MTPHLRRLLATLAALAALVGLGFVVEAGTSTVSLGERADALASTTAPLPTLGARTFATGRNLEGNVERARLRSTVLFGVLTSAFLVFFAAPSIAALDLRRRLAPVLRRSPCAPRAPPRSFV